MTRTIRRILALPRVERWLLFQAAVTLLLVTLSLRTLGPRRCYHGLARLSPMTGRGLLTGEHARHRATRMGWLVGVASGHGLVRANCLTQSLTLWWLLRRQRILTDLCIGVRKHRGRLQAHAWMEHQGRVLNDDPEVCRRFAPFDGVSGAFERRGVEFS